MARYHYTRTHDLDGLHDDLLAAIPELRPQPGVDGRPTAVAVVRGNGDDIWLDVPVTVAKAQLDAVVTAHDPLKHTRARQAAQQEHDDEETTLRKYLASATPNPVLAALIRRVVR